MRDESLLDCALNSPLNLFAYEHPDIAELSAACTFAWVKNRPFFDGNKRIGFAIGALFLQLNGRILTAGEADAVIQTLALAAGGITEKDYALWLAENSKKLRSGVK